MLDASTQFRKPTILEKRLLVALVALAPDVCLPPEWVNNLNVRDMADGGMGSLILVLQNHSHTNRCFGRKAAEIRFADDDGIEVLVSLNLDQNGQLFELDIWKSDFSRLRRIPDNIGNFHFE